MKNDLKPYRFITGKDDDKFCSRVANALNEGYVLYGQPKYHYNDDAKSMFCAQAVINPKFKI